MQQGNAAAGFSHFGAGRKKARRHVDRHRTRRQLGQDREPRRTIVEFMNAIVVVAMALGENADVEAAANDMDYLADGLAAGFAINRNVSGMLHRVANDWNFEQRFLGDKAGLAGYVAGDREDVEEALMIGDQDERLEAGEIFETLYFDADPARPDYSAAPSADDHGDRMMLAA